MPSQYPARPKQEDLLVAVTLSSAQQKFVAGHAKIAKDGSWTFRYVQKDHGVGAFHWRLGALQHCKHGRTRTKGTIPITIHP